MSQPQRLCKTPVVWLPLAILTNHGRVFVPASSPSLWMVQIIGVDELPGPSVVLARRTVVEAAPRAGKAETELVLRRIQRQPVADLFGGIEISRTRLVSGRY